MALLFTVSGQNCGVPLDDPFNDPPIPDAGCSINRPFDGGNGCCFAFFQSAGTYPPCSQSLEGDWVIEFDQSILDDCLYIHDGFLVSYFEQCMFEQFLLPVPISVFGGGSASFSFFSNGGLAVFFDLQYANGVWFVTLDWGGILYSGIMFPDR